MVTVLGGTPPKSYAVVLGGKFWAQYMAQSWPAAAER